MLRLVGIVHPLVSDISWRFNPNWFRKPIYFISPSVDRMSLHPWAKQRAEGVPEYPMQ